jgi:hypothetical protein
MEELEIIIDMGLSLKNLKSDIKEKWNKTYVNN